MFLVLLSGNCRTESPVYWSYYWIICVYLYVYIYIDIHIHILASGYLCTLKPHWLPITLKIKCRLLNMVYWLLFANSISYPFPFAYHILVLWLPFCCSSNTSNCHLKSFASAVPSVWTALPTALCTADSFFFKCQFRCHLLRDCQLPNYLS